MIDPVVEEVGLRRMPVAVAVASLTAVARAARGHDGGRRLRGRGHGQGIPSVAGGVELRPGDRQEHVGNCRRSGPMDGQPGRCARPGGSVRDRGVQLAGMRCVPGARGLDPLLDYLKYEGVLAESPAPASPVEVLVERYRRWLVADRGLAEATVVRYVKLARSVLRQRVTEDGRVENLAATVIVALLSSESSPLSAGSTNGRVAELQALLKFLYVAGLAPQPLVTLVPPVAGWHDTGVPKANPAADVQRLLDSRDRTNPIGVSGRRRGPACHGVQPDRLHPRHRSLLQHELADQDLPWRYVR